MPPPQTSAIEHRIIFVIQNCLHNQCTIQKKYLPRTHTQLWVWIIFSNMEVTAYYEQWKYSRKIFWRKFLSVSESCCWSLSRSSSIHSHMIMIYYGCLHSKIISKKAAQFIKVWFTIYGIQRSEVFIIRTTLKVSTHQIKLDCTQFWPEHHHQILERSLKSLFIIEK